MDSIFAYSWPWCVASNVWQRIGGVVLIWNGGGKAWTLRSHLIHQHFLNISLMKGECDVRSAPHDHMFVRRRRSYIRLRLNRDNPSRAGGVLHRKNIPQKNFSKNLFFKPQRGNQKHVMEEIESLKWLYFTTRISFGWKKTRNMIRSRQPLKFEKKQQKNVSLWGENMLNTSFTEMETLHGSRFSKKELVATSSLCQDDEKNSSPCFLIKIPPLYDPAHRGPGPH